MHGCGLIFLVLFSVGKDLGEGLQFCCERVDWR